MRPLRDISIRYKLALASFVTCTITTSAAIAVLGFHGVRSYEEMLTHEVATVAEVVASHTTAALAFDDSRAATEALAGLSRTSEIFAARLYTADGALFASYDREGSMKAMPGLALSDNGSRLFDDRLVLRRDVILNGRYLGALSIESDLKGINVRIRNYASIGAAAFCLALVLAFGLAGVMQRVLATPVLGLVDLVRRVSTKSDYSLRAEEYSRDEIGTLVRGFNEMLETIQARDTCSSSKHLGLFGLIR